MAVVKNALLSEQEIWNAVYDATNRVLHVRGGSGDGPVAVRSGQEILNLSYDATNKRLKVK